jgi:hypothetical protein
MSRFPGTQFPVPWPSQKLVSVNVEPLPAQEARAQTVNEL